MPRMKGKPGIWGPDEKGRYLAGGTCIGCGAQLIGKYARRAPCEHVPEPTVQDHRDAAVLVLEHVFVQHACPGVA